MATSDRQMNGSSSDPSINVRDLIAATNERTDALREAESRRINERLDLIERHSDRTASLRAEYEEKLRVGEAQRVNAIRTVDVQATEATRSVLASQVQRADDRMAALEKASYTRGGSGSGMEKLWGWVAFAVMALIAIGNVMANVLRK